MVTPQGDKTLSSNRGLYWETPKPKPKSKPPDKTLSSDRGLY